MKLEVVIRTHDGKNIHADKPRYIDVPKKDLIIGCLTSLIRSANLVQDTTVQFTVLDDHKTGGTFRLLLKLFFHIQNILGNLHVLKKKVLTIVDTCNF